MKKENEVSAPAGEADGGGLHGSEPVSRIEAAFREGHLCGRAGGWGTEVDRDWQESQARALSQSPAPQDVGHASDCATHNEPAYPNGPCDCAQSIAEMCAKAYTSWVPGYEPPNGARDALILAAGAINRLLAPAQDVSAPALAEPPNIQGGGLDSGWRTMKSARFYIDCEFDGHGGPLLSIAMVREDGRGIHIRTTEEAADPWVIANVVPLLDQHAAQVSEWVDINDVGAGLRNFIGSIERPVIVADSPVDIGRFCAAISTGRNGGWKSADYPMICFEVHNIDCYPTTLPGAVQHNAWWDAMALRHILLPPSAPNLATQGNTEADTPSAQEGGDARDALIEELRGALSHFVSTAVMEAETHRVYVDEWVLSAARSAYAKAQYAKAHALSRTGREG